MIDAGFGANYDIEAEWKSNNGILESLSGVSEITADICVTSRMTEDKDMVLIMELFDEDNNIVAMDAISVKAKSNETVVPEDILKISDLSNITEDYTLKIFIWDNIISMKSLNKHIVFGESYK